MESPEKAKNLSNHAFFPPFAGGEGHTRIIDYYSMEKRPFGRRSFVFSPEYLSPVHGISLRALKLLATFNCKTENLNLMKKTHLLPCLLLTLVLVSTLSPGLQAASPTEIAALTALYNATDGPNWNNNTNWLNGMDPCDAAAKWFGVVCDGSGNITELNLFNNGLLEAYRQKLDT